MFAIIPIIDDVIAVIDERIQTTAFNAEHALTRDTVPVNVDAIMFWHVHDAEKAAADIYGGHPVALQLRAMNIIYETTKERGATILMPSSMVDSLNPSVPAVALSLASKGVLEPELTRRQVPAPQ